MDKTASEELKQALLGLLIGGGAYGGLRLMKDMGNAAQKQEKPSNELQLTLPASRIPKIAEEHSALSILSPFLAGSAGAIGGWYGGSKIYEAIKKKQISDEQKKVEDQYLTTLQQAHHKIASTQTPNIDKFLEGLITKVGEELKKEGLFGVDIPTEDIGDTVKNQTSRLWDSASHSSLGSGAIAAWLATALGAGGLTYGIANGMKKNKDKNRESSVLPSEIHLNVARHQ